MFMENLKLLTNVLEEKGVDVSNINLDSSLSDLGLDSLDTVSAMMDIEEALNIEFSTEELANAKYIKDIINLIDSKTK